MDSGTAYVPKLYSYIRMSTEQQKFGDSLRRQLEQSERFAVEQGLEFDRSFHLQDIGFSAYDGSNIDKGALGLFLKAVEGGQIKKGSYLGIESFDRLSRQKVRKALGIFLELLDHGITIVTLMDGRIYRPENVDVTDLIVSLLVMARAHEESETKSRRVSEAWQQKRNRLSSEILTRRCVGWVQPRPDRSGFELIADRAAVVRTIFEHAADHGMGADLIARRFNQQRVPTFGRSTGWHKSYVQKILHNRAVLGEFACASDDGKGTTHKAYYPAVIEESTFNRAQTGMAQRRQVGAGRKGKRISNLFSGLLVCGTCYGAMHLIDKGKKGGRRLVCDKARRGLGCRRVSWAYDEFERAFLTFVSKIDVTEFFQDPADDQLTALKKKTDDLKNKLYLASNQRDKIFEVMKSVGDSEYICSQFQAIEEEVKSHAAAVKVADLEVQTVLNDHQIRADRKRDALGLIDRLQTDQSQETTIVRSTVAHRFGLHPVRLTLA
jgi:DNA invertase Pin-like site-specific DNA recombinase